jgi:hypothetical protein
MKKIISLLFLTLLIFAAGCSATEETIKTGEPTKVSEILGDDMSETANAILNQDLYDEAVRARDTETCKTIEDRTRSNECTTVINSLNTTDEAVAAIDRTICNKIKLERYKENCVNQVNGAIDARTEQELLRKNEAAIQKASDAGDESLCDNLEEDAMYSCRAQIIINKAHESADASLCDEIGREDLINDCKRLVQT